MENCLVHLNNLIFGYYSIKQIVYFYFFLFHGLPLQKAMDLVMLKAQSIMEIYEMYKTIKKHKFATQIFLITLGQLMPEPQMS